MHREYAPELGRWISEDPLGLVDGPNVQSYVSNRPISAGDLLGLSAQIHCEQIKGKGYLTDVGLKFVNARHCFLEVECPGKYHVTLEIYGPQPGFPNGKPMNQPYNPDRARNTTSRWVKDPCPENCDFEDKLIKSFETQSQNLPTYDARGPNSNTFVRRVIEGAGGTVPHFPGGAYGWDFK